ncbi:JmjC domain-containing protein [Caenispirillum salinarum]|uniref:JmjC domain-containing protein n=1 Tax=Caenispirillum salinarum TaxID=859058 RepID=UPI00384E3ED8
MVVKDATRTVPPQAYCTPETDRRNQQVLQPDPAKVMDLVRAGCSLGLNRLDTLDAGLRAVGAVLEDALAGRAQANLYYSRRSNQAFGVHSDSHDVFALHCEGEKEWHLYEGADPDPINHPAFKKLPLEERRRRAGRVAETLVMKPGDLLYIPRGQYHDALCRTDDCVHVAYGVTQVIGMDLLTLLMNRAPADAAFRRALPHPEAADYDTALAAQLADLGDRLKAMASDAESRAFLRQYQTEHFRTRRGGYSFPITGPTAQEQAQAAQARAKAGGTRSPGAGRPLPAQARAAIIGAVKPR